MKGESDDCPVDRAWPKANKRAKLKRQNKQAEPTASTAAKSARKRLDFGHQGNRGKVQDFLILRMALDEKNEVASNTDRLTDKRTYYMSQNFDIVSYSLFLINHNVKKIQSA